MQDNAPSGDNLDGLSRDELLRLMPLVDEAERRVVRDNLETYSLWVAPQEPPARHHKLIMSELQALERSGHGRLMIFAPPGSAKSLTASVKFPSWYLGRHPQHDMICASHTASLAEMFGRRVRNTLADPAFEGTFGVSVSKDNASVGSWSTSHSGRFHAVGVGGSPSGRRADCVVGSTMVETNHGRIRIDKIDVDSSSCYIKSYDEHKKLPVFRKVLAVARRNASEFYRIRTASGNVVEATGNHRFYVRGRWLCASALSVGDILLSCLPKASTEKCGRPEKKIPSWCSLHSGLQPSMRNENEQHAPWFQDRISLPKLWNPSARRAHESMFKRMRFGTAQKSMGREKGATEKLRSLFKKVFAKNKNPALSVLFQSMRGYCSFSAYGWKRKSTLARRYYARKIQKWGAILVQENKADGLFAGWKLLCGLHEYAHPACSPYRFGCDEQRTDKPRNTLPKMPLGIPRSGERETAEDVVAVVERICGEEVVYDIEVEETHNFFANGVLVHNCLIMDDLVPNREQADSINYHDKCWEWWQSDIRTRLKPKSIAVLIMCMTGDTSVMLADGGEKPLRDIRPGDAVATYKDGKLSYSVVKNWVKNHPDSVYEIKTTSGIIVKANERHPFLVSDDGVPKWIRLKNLRPGQEMFRVNGASGKEKLALGMGARNPWSVGDIAHRIMIKNDGLTGFVRHLSTLLIDAKYALKAATESLSMNLTAFFQYKAESVPFVENFQEKMSERIGAENFASTTVTTQKKSGDCSATIVTSSSAMQKRLRLLWPQQSTSDFILDKIVEINPAGKEEVFDVEIADTENFIANGLVSHNTRWSPDDIAGRLLDDMKTGGEQWKVISLPMEAEADDMLGREPGELLWPEWFTPDMVRIAKRDARGWSALYQQRPVPDSGDYFKREWIQWYDDRPESMNVYGASDYAVTAEGDYTVHMVAGVDEKDDLYLLDVWRGKEHTDVWVEQLLSLIRQWKPVEWAEESGQIEKSVGPFIDKRMQETKTYCYRRQFPSSKDKPTRAQSIRGRLAQGKVYFPRSRPWVADLVSEMMEFPVGKHDDMCDTLGLFGRILDDTRRPVKPKSAEPTRWLQNLTINEIIRRKTRARMEKEW